MLRLPNVTLVMADTNCQDFNLKVLRHCASLVEFGAIKLFSNLTSVPAPIQPVKVSFKGLAGYNNFIMLELARHITTDFVLIVQADGFILNVDRWRDKFLDYDYVGAPWSVSLHREHPSGTRVGNGGFSLRSKKLLDAAAKLTDYNSARRRGYDQAEDFHLCKTRYQQLAALGLKFEDLETAADFSLEVFNADCPRDYSQVFGFHGSPKNKYRTQAFLDMVRNKY